MSEKRGKHKESNENQVVVFVIVSHFLHLLQFFHSRFLDLLSVLHPFSLSLSLLSLSLSLSSLHERMRREQV